MATLEDKMTFGTGDYLPYDGGTTTFEPPVNEEAPAIRAFVDVAPTVTGSALNQRANKYDYALGDNSPGVDVLKGEAVSGREAARRKLEAAREFSDDQAIRMEFIQDYAKQKQGPITKDETDMIMAMTRADMKDPNTYFEKAYARKFIAAMSLSDADDYDVAIDGTVIDTTALNDAMQEDPEAAHAILDAGEIIKAKNEVALKLYEDMDARWQALGWGAKGISDTAEMATPFLSWYRMMNLDRGKNEKRSTLLGNNLKETYERLNLITDVDEYRTTVTKIAEDLFAKNGYDAMMFIKGLLTRVE